MSEPKQAIQVFCALPSRHAAESMARQLVENRLAACVQVLGPISSTYRWEGAIETAEEWLCLIKSREDLYRALEAAIRASHPYEVPEIIAVPISAGNPDYLDWLGRETGDIERS